MKWEATVTHLILSSLNFVMLITEIYLLILHFPPTTTPQHYPPALPPPRKLSDPADDLDSTERL